MASRWRADLDLPASLDTARVARRILDQILHAWGDPDFGDDARLITTELITNAYRHAGPGPIHLAFELDLNNDRFCIWLSDASHELPVVRQVDHNTEAGHGMRIVHHLVDTWGSNVHDTGKTVWVELRRHRNR